MAKAFINGIEFEMSIEEIRQLIIGKERDPAPPEPPPGPLFDEKHKFTRNHDLNVTTPIVTRTADRLRRGIISAIPQAIIKAMYEMERPVSSDEIETLLDIKSSSGRFTEMRHAGIVRIVSLRRPRTYALTDKGIETARRIIDAERKRNAVPAK